MKRSYKEKLINLKRLAATGALAIVFLIFACGDNPAPVQTSAEKQAAAKTVKKKLMKNKWNDIELTGDYIMDTRLLFLLGTVWNRTADIGEVIDTASRIRSTSELSWYREWYATAQRVQNIGDEALSRGHRVSAGEAYLRAGNYYLASEVFLHTDPTDQRILQAYKKGGDCFMRGYELLGMPVELVQIPYEGTYLRGYFYRSVLASGRAPVVMLHQGFDAPVESTTQAADAAVKRGFHCLLFEGPGQGLSIREQGLPFRVDWEKPVAAVVDYLVSRSDVDASRLALVGTSMGGGFAARALAYEHRIKVGVLNPGYVEIYRLFKDMLDPRIINLYEEDPAEFNDKMSDLAKFSVVLRWGLNHAMWAFGAQTPAELITFVKKYNYAGDIPKIGATILIMDGEDEEYGKGQAKEVYDLLTCPKTYLFLNRADTASVHCQGGANALGSARMFDWLEENL